MGREELLSRQAEDYFAKLLEGRDMAQEIKPKQAVHGALGRKIVAGDRHGLDILSQADNSGDGDKRHIFKTARRENTDPALRLRRVTANGESHLRRNDGGGGSRIDDHPKNFGIPRAFKSGISDQNRRRTSVCSGHSLKGGSVTRRQPVVRVGDKRQSLPAQHFLMDSFPVRRMSQEASADRDLCSRPQAVHCDQQPLSVKSLPDSVDGLSFHGKGYCTTPPPDLSAEGKTRS